MALFHPLVYDVFGTWVLWRVNSFSFLISEWNLFLKKKWISPNCFHEFRIFLIFHVEMAGITQFTNFVCGLFHLPHVHNIFSRCIFQKLAVGVTKLVTLLCVGVWANDAKITFFNCESCFPSLLWDFFWSVHWVEKRASIFSVLLWHSTTDWLPWTYSTSLCKFEEMLRKLRICVVFVARGIFWSELWD